MNIFDNCYNIVMANKDAKHPLLSETLTESDLESLDLLFTGSGRPKGSKYYLDEVTDIAGYFLQMKLYGTMTFRIMHSQGLWIKVKKALAEVGIDVEDLPEWTPLSEKIKGVRWYKKDILGASDVWAALLKIDRRGNKDLDEADL